MKVTPRSWALARPWLSAVPPSEATSGAERADELLGGVDHQLLDRLVHLAVDLAGDDLRPRDLELVPLAAHRLDQDREVQLAATGDGEDVRLAGRLDAQREIRLQLALEPLLELA